MSRNNKKIRWNRLTSDQKELIYTIERKWLTVARCTDRIDRQQAINAINAVYFDCVGKVPKIIFADSPRVAIEMGEQRDKYTGQLSRDVYMDLRRLLILRTRENLRGEFTMSFRQPIHNRKNSDGSYSSSKQILLAVSVQFWAYEAMILDVACSVFGSYFEPNFPRLQQKWEALQLLVTSCGFICPFQDICFVSDRPTELIFKDDFILHAVNRPAVVFSDGYKIYVENGIYVSDSPPYLDR
jgi:hypothetical protein